GPARRHVRRRDHRDRTHGAGPREPLPPVHAGAAAVAAATGPAAADRPDPDRGLAPGPLVGDRGLSVPASLPLSGRRIVARGSKAAAGRTEPLGRVLESPGPS